MKKNILCLILLFFCLNYALFSESLSDIEAKLIGTWFYVNDFGGNKYSSNEDGYDAAKSETNKIRINSDKTFEYLTPMEYVEKDTALPDNFKSSWSLTSEDEMVITSFDYVSNKEFKDTYRIIFENNNKNIICTLIATTNERQNSNVNIYKIYCVKEE